MVSHEKRIKILNEITKKKLISRLIVIKKKKRYFFRKSLRKFKVPKKNDSIKIITNYLYHWFSLKNRNFFFSVQE